ncbi:hypothetical protein Clacol_006894 [Clathrus columnatus]|uniref:AMP-dependent synthetase/ligase domain-containing protein n=1 Tax=Clathrus columnatus TaxID=1419009 RepID=A0AAV5AIG3_9AGAM|nr:hypothetical protein Clacol_006894 [Clathrus columnatus]
MTVHRRWEERGINVEIIQGWGLTETSLTCTAQKLEDFPAKIGSVGGLLAGLKAQLVKDNGIDDVNQGEPREIWIKELSIMKGIFIVFNTSDVEDKGPTLGEMKCRLSILKSLASVRCIVKHAEKYETFFDNSTRKQRKFCPELYSKIIHGEPKEINLSIVT